jgi:hypothetical protein
MAEYILLMHDDANPGDDTWNSYIRKLQQSGSFEGGSAIGDGICTRKQGTPASLTAHLTGYIRVKADNLEQARSHLIGNPHFEAGGTVEIRELPPTSGVIAQLVAHRWSRAFKYAERRPEQRSRAQRRMHTGVRGADDKGDRLWTAYP